MKFRLSQKPGTHTPRSAASMSTRSHAEPGEAPAINPDGTPIAIATSSAERVSSDVGSARSHNACVTGDRKSTRLNSSHGYISYAVFCLKKKKKILSYGKSVR